MRKNMIPLLTAFTLFLSGCSQSPQSTSSGQKWQSEWTMVGKNIGIEAPAQLTLSENNEALAANGLYYATWVTGDSVPYTNSDGKSVDLYDAQLYFLASESRNGEKALENCANWLDKARENYDIKTEETVICGEQSYTLITYQCAGEDTPYAKGVSAFGTHGVNAVCAEFTCVENYEEDLESILTEFLNGCHYRADS